MAHGGCGGAAESCRAQALSLHAAKRQLELVENNSPTPFSTPGNSWQLGPDPERGGRLGTGGEDRERGEQPCSCRERQGPEGFWPREKRRVWLTGAGVGKETASSASHKNAPGISAWAFAGCRQTCLTPGCGDAQAPAAAERPYVGCRPYLPRSLPSPPPSCRARGTAGCSGLPFDVSSPREGGGGCTEPPGLCRPSPCGALQRSGGDGLGPPSGC